MKRVRGRNESAKSIYEQFMRSGRLDRALQRGREMTYCFKLPSGVNAIELNAMRELPAFILIYLKDERSLADAKAQLLKDIEYYEEQGEVVLKRFELRNFKSVSGSVMCACLYMVYYRGRTSRERRSLSDSPAFRVRWDAFVTTRPKPKKSVKAPKKTSKAQASVGEREIVAIEKSHVEEPEVEVRTEEGKAEVAEQVLHFPEDFLDKLARAFREFVNLRANAR